MRHFKQVQSNVDIPNKLHHTVAHLVANAAKTVGLILPELGKLYGDLYTDPKGKFYYRISFYVSWPYTDEMLAVGHLVAAHMNLNNSAASQWIAKYARRSTRLTDSVKCHTYIQIS